MANEFVVRNGLRVPSIANGCTLISCNGTIVGGQGVIGNGDCTASTFRTALGNIVGADCSTAFGIGNAVYSLGSSVNGGILNIIARDALPNTQSGGYSSTGFVGGVLTLSSGYGDLTSYYTPGSTISARNAYTFPQINCLNLAVCNSSFSGGYTTVCVDPSVNVCNIQFIKTGPFTASSDYLPNTIGGGSFNMINGSPSNTLSGSTISGGYCNIISNSCLGTISGGSSNKVITSNCSSVSGGFGNLIASSCNSVISGGTFNRICCSSGDFIGGGGSNFSCAGGAIINGFLNVAANGGFVATGGGNQASNLYSVVLSGNGGQVATGIGSFIGTGWANTSSGSYAFTGSGRYNISQATFGFIGNGVCNVVRNLTCETLALGATVVGGVGNNTVGGVFNCTFLYFSSAPTVCNAGAYSFIGGGFQNVANGDSSAILGGRCNRANGCACAFIVGSNITANRACATFVNNLSIMNIPTSSAGLPSGAIWRDTTAGDVLKIVP
jgi:hypothetical protein